MPHQPLPVFKEITPAPDAAPALPTARQRVGPKPSPPRPATAIFAEGPTAVARPGTRPGTSSYPMVRYRAKPHQPVSGSEPQASAAAPPATTVSPAHDLAFAETAPGAISVSAPGTAPYPLAAAFHPASSSASPSPTRLRGRPWSLSAADDLSPSPHPAAPKPAETSTLRETSKGYPVVTAQSLPPMRATHHPTMLDHGPPGEVVRNIARAALEAEREIDGMLAAARRGEAFSPAELLALQARVFRYNQAVEILSRAVDRIMGAVRQTLGTQV